MSFHGAKSKQIPKLRILPLRLFRIKRNHHRVSAMEKWKAWVGSRAENQAVPVSTVPAAGRQLKWLSIGSLRTWICGYKCPTLHVNQT